MKYLILGLLCVLLLFGCVSNEDATKSGESDIKNGTKENKDAMQGDKGTEGQQGGETESADPVSDLMNFLNPGSSTAWKVDYDFVSTVRGQTSSSGMTQYRKGDSKLRTDLSGQGYVVRTYILSDQSYSCSQQAGVWSCTSFSSEELSGPSSDPQSDLEDLSKYEINSLPDKSVAGVQAKCFSVKDESVTSMYCFSQEGVLLYLESKGVVGGAPVDLRMEAKSYTTQVSDSDFELPAEPQELGSDWSDLGGGQDLNCEEICSGLTGDETRQCLEACQGN